MPPPATDRNAESPPGFSEIARLSDTARRIETPCGAGTMVWRLWGNGEALVLAHGGQGAWSHWVRNIGPLADKRMVIVPDLPGHGESAMPEAEDHPAISQALAEGLRQILGEGTKADLVGFSFGGVALAWLAALHPAMARRLVLVGTGGLDTPKGEIRVGRVRGLVGAEREAALSANLLGLMLHYPESADALARHLLETNGRAARLAPAPLVIPDRLLAVLADVRCPVDAIWGALDRPHPDPALQEAVLRRLRPELRFRVIADAGHWAMYERYEAFNTTLIALLDTAQDRP